MSLSAEGSVRDFRLLVGATIANGIGSGMYLPVAALYLTQIVGLSITEAGFAFLVAGCVAIASTVGSGSIIDRFGPRNTYLSFLVGSLLGMVGILSARSTIIAIASLTVFTMFDRAAAVARSALIGVLFTGAIRMRYRAYLRSFGNGALGVGALFTIPILNSPTEDVYMIAVSVNASSYLISALVLFPIKNIVIASPEGMHGGPFGDRQFLVVVALIGVVGLHIEVLGFGLPLWVRESTQAPDWIIAALIVINTVGVMAFQVLLSRGTDKVSTATRALLLCAVLLGASLVFLGISGTTGPGLGVVTLLMFGVLYTGGEILFTASSLGLTYAFAQEHSHGRYQAVLNTSLAISRAIAPSIISLLCLDRGPFGWTVLGILIVLAGGAAFAVIRFTPRHPIAS